MTWLAPLGLLGLLTLPLIMLLHLIQQRRRRLRVPSLELWSPLDAPVQRKPRRLPITLLLILHLLVATFLGLSLGRPLLPGALFQPTNTIVILDTSTSMAATDATGAGGSGTGPASGRATRFSAAQAELREILFAARPGDRIGLVALGPTPRLLGHGGPESAELLVRAAETLQPAGPDGDLAAALNLATTAAEPGSGQALRNRVVVLTDVSFGREAPAQRPLLAEGEVEWRVFGRTTDNVAIVAFAARPRRDGGQQLYARVVNLGSSPVARSLSVLLDGETVHTEPVRLDPDAEAEWSWPLPEEAQIAEARLTPGDHLLADDRVASVLAGGARVRVQLISASPTPLERALKAQPGVEVSLATPSSYVHDPEADVAVLVGFVPPLLPSIPTLIVAPPAENPLITVGSRTRERRADEPHDDRFAGIDLRSIAFAHVPEVEAPPWAATVLSAGEVPLVLTGIWEKQPRTIWTFDPAASNLQGRLAFPLLTAATLRTLLPYSGSALKVGAAAPQPLIGPDGESIPTGAILSEPGLYSWVEQEGAVVVNVLDADESDLGRRRRPLVETAAASQASATREADHHLWRILLWGAVVTLLLEWLYSHAAARTRRPRLERRPQQRPV